MPALVARSGHPLSLLSSPALVACFPCSRCDKHTLVVRERDLLELAVDDGVRTPFRRRLLHKHRRRRRRVCAPHRSTCFVSSAKARTRGRERESTGGRANKGERETEARACAKERERERERESKDERKRRLLEEERETRRGFAGERACGRELNRQRACALSSASSSTSSCASSSASSSTFSSDTSLLHLLVRLLFRLLVCLYLVPLPSIAAPLRTRKRRRSYRSSAGASPRR